MFIAKNNDLIILASQTREELEQALQFMVYTDIEETDVEYELYNGEYLTKEEIKEKELERLNHLSLTKREVFLAIYRDKGKTPEQIRAMITDPEGLIEFDFASSYFRGNPLISQLGEALGYTPTQLNILFETLDCDIDIFIFDLLFKLLSSNILHISLVLLMLESTSF